MSRRMDEIKKFRDTFSAKAQEAAKELDLYYGADYWRLIELNKLVDDWNNGVIPTNLKSITSICACGFGDDDMYQHPELSDKLDYLASGIYQRAYWNSIGKMDLVDAYKKDKV